MQVFARIAKDRKKGRVLAYKSLNQHQRRRLMSTKKEQKNKIVQCGKGEKSKEVPSIHRIDVSGCMSATNVI